MKSYLGDGVYAESDPHGGAGIALTTENGIQTTNTIYLEPEVQDALAIFMGFVKPKKEGTG